MDKKIRFEITADGEIHVKTLGMDDESCLDYVEVFERILDAETIDSSYTDEFIEAQLIQSDEVSLQQMEDIQIKRE